MIGYNCVMARLLSPDISKLHNVVIDNLANYINTEALAEYGNGGKLVDEDPHITLIYDLDPINITFLNKFLRINCRKAYHDLKNNRMLRCKPVVANTFDGDLIVLKLDFTNNPDIQYISQLSKELTSLPNQWQFSDPYRPHCTLAYLQPDTPKDLINKTIQELNKYTATFMIDCLLASSSDGDQSVIAL